MLAMVMFTVMPKMMAMALSYHSNDYSEDDG